MSMNNFSRSLAVQRREREVTVITVLVRGLVDGISLHSCNMVAAVPVSGVDSPLKNKIFPKSPLRSYWLGEWKYCD